MQPMSRERRIDILRGIAIVTILLNHFALTFRAVGYAGQQIVTPTQLGYSSAASIFVALSGYMVGLVYMRRADPVRAVLRRAVELYLINFAVFLVVSPAALFADPARDRFWFMQRLLDDPLDGTIRFLTLRDAPAFLDVLQLYVALLLMTPLAMLLARRSRGLLVAASLGLWALIQLWPFVMPAGGPAPIVGRTLNALAWQLAFFPPMVAGMSRLHEPVFAWFARNRWSVALLVAALAVFAWLHAVDPLLAPARIHLALTDRPAHGPVWTLHALLLLAAYLGLLALATPWLAAWPFRLLASLGRNSLNVYVASIPLIFATALSIGALRIDFAGYLAGVALVVLASVAVALWGDARRARGRGVSGRLDPAQRFATPG
jgi:hypothetical protein